MIFKKEWFQVTLLLIIFLSLLYIPLTIRVFQTPSQQFYTGAEKFYPDYYSILSIMNIGSKNITYPVHVEYQILGKIAAAVNIPSYIFYHVIRILVSALIFLSLYKLSLLLNINKSSRILMLVTGLFLSSPPVFQNFYRPPDMFNLYTQSLHHEIGIFLTILLFIFYLQKKYILLLATAPILGIIHAVSAMIIALTVSCHYLLARRSPANWRGVGGFLLFLLAPLVFYKIQFSLDPVLREIGSNFESNFAKTDLAATTPQMLFSYLFHLAPFIILSLPLAKNYKKLSSFQKNAGAVAFFYIISFIVMSLIGFYFLGVSRVRFNLVAFPLAFSVLIGISWNMFSNLKLLTFLLFFSLPSWFFSMKNDIYINDYLYPKTGIIQAASQMKNLPYRTVLSLDYSGQFIGSFGGQMPYLNSGIYTVGYSEKLVKANNFFDGKMTPFDAQNFLKSENIAYVFLGPYEKRSEISYPFLNIIYQNSLVTIYQYQNQLPPSPRDIKLPILLYHYVEVVKDPKDTIRQKMDINPKVFESQIKTLQENNYQTIFIKDISNSPPHSVALTFDDGYKDFYTDVFPILKKYNTKATAYIVYNFLDKPNYMSKENIKEIYASGLVEIASHTLNHPNLKSQNPQKAQTEIVDSKKFLEELIGEKVMDFAYPYGAYNQALENMVKDAGYLTSTTVENGLAAYPEDSYKLKRLRPGSRTGQSLIKFLSP